MELLIKSMIISGFCVGLRIVSSKGMILYFLRMPYEYIVKRKEDIQEAIETHHKRIGQILNNREYLIQMHGPFKEDEPDTTIPVREKLTYFKAKHQYTWLIYILKALIGCVTCMAGIWTILIEFAYYDLSRWTILTLFIVAAMNSIVYAVYEKLTK